MNYIEKMVRNVEIIARRTQELNPHAPPTWADSIVDDLNAHEIGVAIGYIFQSVFSADDESVLDIRLHDALYLIAISNQLPDAHQTSVKDLGCMTSYAVNKYEREEFRRLALLRFEYLGQRRKHLFLRLDI